MGSSEGKCTVPTGHAWAMARHSLKDGCKVEWWGGGDWRSVPLETNGSTSSILFCSPSPPSGRDIFVDRVFKLPPFLSLP